MVQHEDKTMRYYNNNKQMIEEQKNMNNKIYDEKITTANGYSMELLFV